MSEFCGIAEPNHDFSRIKYRNWSLTSLYRLYLLVLEFISKFKSLLMPNLMTVVTKKVTIRGPRLFLLNQYALELGS